MADESVPHAEFRVSEYIGGEWHVLATGFTGLLGASRWLYDTLDTRTATLRLEQRAIGRWRHVYMVGPHTGEIVP